MSFWRFLYEMIILLAVITYAILIFADPADHPYLTEALIKRVDLGLILFFGTEYLIRLYLARDKQKFVRENWFDIIAMIPFDLLFPLARLMRVLRVVRLLKASPLLWNVLKSNQMRKIFAFLAVILLWSASAVYLLEQGNNDSFQTWGDALWWSIVTTTTVGYGDISPVTEGGRIIAAFLMISGIGLIGTFTANLANHWMTFFETPTDEESLLKMIEEELPHEDDRLQQQMKHHAMQWVHHIGELSDAEYRTLLRTLEMLRDYESRK
ncbi:voltage-gated potassium channel [Tumebacillus sp. BK434]|uniref:ion transporter n=1 Tax=Tumebacillus sp. BK434 TaxID=2512169 RepID=UPI001048BA0F|nr:ion transporter [Tumebacillus sp. BK434]TCP58100.1 voltage-gated potassium channel [Tumebacillus sp. BK434]